MKEFIEPESIAIVGASSHPAKLGYRVVRNLVDSGYKGKIVPINPKGGYICGIKAYPSVSEASKELGKIDLAIIVVRAELVPKVLVDIGEAGTRHVVIITSGFEEAGRKDLADEVKRIAQRYGIRIIGPNCAGIINTLHDMNASFIAYPPRGPVSVISQSGALGAALVYHMLHTGMGMTAFFSIGNMMDVTFVDLLEPVAEISGAVALYVEGVKDGRAFYDALIRAKRKAPIVALKAGRTAAGMRAAASHTGSLATSREIVRGMFRQARVPIVDEIYELGEVANFLAKMKGKAKKPIKNVGILTNAGGGSVLSADFSEAYGIVVPELDIDVELPRFASRKNPIDVTAMGKYDEFYRVVRALEKDERIDAILVINVVPTFMLTDPLEHAMAVVDAYEGTKPIAAVRLTGKIAEPGRKYLEDHNIPTFSDIRTAIKGFGAFNEEFF